MYVLVCLLGGTHYMSLGGAIILSGRGALCACMCMCMCMIILHSISLLCLYDLYVGGGHYTNYGWSPLYSVGGARYIQWAGPVILIGWGSLHGEGAGYVVGWGTH